MPETTATAIHPELACLLDACSADLRDDTHRLVAADWCCENEYESLEKLLRWLARVQPPEMLFTGSRRYGVPKPESDWDWVVRLYWNNTHELEQFCDSKTGSGQAENEDFRALDTTLRFGPVNLLVVSSERQWVAWTLGTTELVRRAPVTRDDAIAVFTAEFEAQRLTRFDY